MALVALIGVGIRLLVMQSVQARRDRENRQVNERLRTLIAADLQIPPQGPTRPGGASGGGAAKGLSWSLRLS